MFPVSLETAAFARFSLFPLPSNHTKFLRLCPKVSRRGEPTNKTTAAFLRPKLETRFLYFISEN